MDVVRIPITEELEAIVAAAAAGDHVVIVRENEPVAEVRPISTPAKHQPNLLSREWLAGGAERRKALGIKGDISGIVRAMRDEGY